MEKRHRLLLLLTLCMVSSFRLFSEVRLPAILGSHMVLQQKSEVKLWGWCDPGEKIQIRADWDTVTLNTVGLSNAKWSIQMHTPAAGGPYKITITAGNVIVLDDVLIGEVWLCSGQSNMEMSVHWGLDYPDDVAHATNNSIRFFHVPRLTADFPQDDTKAAWVVCNPADMKRFSAVGYFFGYKLQQTLNLPVGLINASWGGTPAEVWTPAELIENDAALRGAAKKLTPAPEWPINAGTTYNAMIHPLAGFQLAGALWYQGEANVITWATYPLLLTTMIGAWRKAFQKEFPFYFVQIAPFAGYSNNNVSALLREAQTKVSSYPNTGMVTISDLVDNINDIHPKLKKEVGFRLADYALAETYGKKEHAYKSPQYKGMKVEKNRVRLEFDNAEKGLVSKGGPPTEFFIAGEDQHFMPAMAKIEDRTIVVWNKAVKNPAAVRFGFSNSAMPNLFSKDGLPVNLFRTDDWQVNTDPVK